MNDLRLVEEVFIEIGKGPSIFALAIPAGSGLCVDGPEMFPQFFRGFVAGRYPHLPPPCVEEIYCPRELYQKAGLSQTLHPLTLYRVDGCASNVLEDFVTEYEGKYGKPESDHELALVTMTADWGEQHEAFA